MYRVLIVDDEPVIAEGLQMLIDWEAHGFTIKDTADNGFDALHKLSGNHYHLMVTDIRMPDMDGLELIGQLNRNGCHVHTVILSGYGDFSYAKKAMQHGVNQYLLKPVDVDELKETLLKIKAELDEARQRQLANLETNRNARAKMLMDLTNGSLSGKGWAQLSARYGIELEEPIRIAIIEMAEHKHLYRAKPSDASLYQFGLHNIAEELIEQSGLGYVYDDFFGRVGIVIRAMDISNLTLKLRHVRAAMKTIFKTDVRIGVSGMHGRRDIADGKQEALHMLDVWSRSKEAVLFFQAEWEGGIGILDLSWDIAPLIHAVESGDKLGMEAGIDTFMQEIGARELTRSEVQGILYSILFRFKGLCQKHGIDIRELRPDPPESAAGQADHVREWLSRICVETCRYILSRNARGEKQPELIDQIVAYVHEHYMEELSLKEMAAKFYLNAAYLGQLFKGKMCEPFSDYVNKVRIAEVKRMVLQEKGKMIEFIQKAGYNNVEHFYRQFKRFEGIPFGEYKAGKLALMHRVKKERSEP